MPIRPFLASLFRDGGSPAPKARTPSRQVLTVETSGQSVEVAIRRNPRARRYTLRLNPRGGATVTIPRRGTIAEAKAFVTRHGEWLVDRLKARIDATPVEITAIALRGTTYAIRPTGALRGSVKVIAETDGRAALAVAGAPEHLRRRVTDYLMREARSDLQDAVTRHAATLGVRPTAIRLKDTTSRWGSASTRGTLCFSWRLIMAPPFVLDYVAAHEVAHLREMNHSERFWEICRGLAPRTDEAKAWLKAHGMDLHRAI